MGKGHHQAEVNTTTTNNSNATYNQTNNNRKTNEHVTHETNDQTTTVHGDAVRGGQLSSRGDTNSGRAIYALQNLDTLNYGAQVFGKLPNGQTGHSLYDGYSAGQNPYTMLGLPTPNHRVLLVL